MSELNSVNIDLLLACLSMLESLIKNAILELEILHWVNRSCCLIYLQDLR